MSLGLRHTIGGTLGKRLRHLEVKGCKSLSLRRVRLVEDKIALVVEPS